MSDGRHGCAFCIVCIVSYINERSMAVSTLIWGSWRRHQRSWPSCGIVAGGPCRYWPGQGTCVRRRKKKKKKRERMQAATQQTAQRCLRGWKAYGELPTLNWASDPSPASPHRERASPPRLPAPPSSSLPPSQCGAPDMQKVRYNTEGPALKVPLDSPYHSGFFLNKQ